MLVCKVPISTRCCSSLFQSSLSFSALASVVRGVASTVQSPMILLASWVIPSISKVNRDPFLLSSTRFEQPVLCNVSGLRNRMDRLLPFSHRQRIENMRIGLISPKSRRPLQRSIYKSARTPLSVSIRIIVFKSASPIRRRQRRSHRQRRTKRSQA